MFRQDVQEETAIGVGLILPPSHTPAARRWFLEILFASPKRVLYHQAGKCLADIGWLCAGLDRPRTRGGSGAEHHFNFREISHESSKLQSNPRRSRAGQPWRDFSAPGHTSKSGQGASGRHRTVQDLYYAVDGLPQPALRAAA